MRAARLLSVLLLVGACASTAPVAIRVGDVCFHCRRTIAEPALAAEILSGQHAFKFSSVACLTEYLREHPNEPVKAIFVTDYPTVKLFPADGAHFVKFEVEPRVGAKGYAAFRDANVARTFANEKHASVVPWDDVQKDATIEHAAH